MTDGQSLLIFSVKIHNITKIICRNQFFYNFAFQSTFKFN